MGPHPGGGPRPGGAGPGRPAPTTGVDLSNTSTVRFGRPPLLPHRGGAPLRGDPGRGTDGRTDLGGGLTHGLSAHAKHDPSTGELHQVGYTTLSRPYAVWQVIDHSGRVTRTVPIDLAEPVMIHTATLTPAPRPGLRPAGRVLDLGAFAQGWSVPFTWDPTTRRGSASSTGRAAHPVDRPAAGLRVPRRRRPRHGPGTGRRRGHLPPSVRLRQGRPAPRHLPAGAVGRSTWRPGRWTGPCSTTGPRSSPGWPPATFGRPNRYTYAVGADRGDLRVALGVGNAVVRHDHRDGTTHAGPRQGRAAVAEAVFVPDPGRAGAEDGGWLLAFVHDAATDSSEFVVLDAQEPPPGRSPPWPCPSGCRRVPRQLGPRPV